MDDHPSAVVEGSFTHSQPGSPKSGHLRCVAGRDSHQRALTVAVSSRIQPPAQPLDRTDTSIRFEPRVRSRRVLRGQLAFQCLTARFGSAVQFAGASAGMGMLGDAT